MNRFQNTLQATILLFAVFAAVLLDAAGITLNWNDNSSNEDGFSIERSLDGIRFEEIAKVAADVTQYSDQTAIEGTTYHYRLRAFNAFGHSGYTNTVTDLVKKVVSSVKQPVGAPSNQTAPILNELPSYNLPSKNIGLSRTATYRYDPDSAIHSFISVGNGIGDRSDQLNYAYFPSSGDGQIILRATNLYTFFPTTQVGFMYRNSLAPDSAFAAVALSGSGNASALWRTTDAASSGTKQVQKLPSSNAYLKIRRHGPDCWIASSVDGFDWSSSYKIPATLAPDSLAGLFLASARQSLSIAILEVLESTEPLLPPSLSDYSGSRKEAAIGLSTARVSTTYDAATRLYELTDQGRGFELYRDQLNFNYWTGKDSCRIVAKIHAFKSDGSWARTGVSIRASLEPDAAQAAITLNGYGKLEILYRSQKGQRIVSRHGARLPDGCYLALERQGDKVFFQWSADGALWNDLKTVNIQLPSIHQVGLALGSHNGSSSSLIELTGLY